MNKIRFTSVRGHRVRLGMAVAFTAYAAGYYCPWYFAS